ncbi:hypothetical protein LTR69_006681 [Exophiala sideris]|uniref:Nucleoside phosphorylase domain-containing protein n=1 Tax=Exophiala sideris TaxID=1016849 RepID=A0ABR0J9B5_9EURO|nr:hypothetical protein LTR69_006681 [Exophiala sideris]
MPRRPIEEYQVGWVCALPKELTAARAMLDEEHEPYSSQVPHDNNSYVLGRIHGHNVVMACLPAGVYGTVSAATVASNMRRTFTGIRFGLMVGIGGGIPNLDHGADVRLGDVVVSQPDGTHGGVVQYDFRKNLGDGVFERKGVLRPPPTLLLTTLASLQSRHQMNGNHILETLSAVLERFPSLADEGFVHPGPETDVLFCGNVNDHKDGSDCTRCQNGIAGRRPRGDRRPKVHYGTIASGNELMKNVVERDRLGQEFSAKCVEMEAAGLMIDFPCIVVRGICDYADSHKNDMWQEYAAITAAGFTKELLSIVKIAEVTNVKQDTEATKHNRGLNLYDAPDMGEDLFFGRQTEMQQMELILQPQSNTLGVSRRVLVLGGMGGIGKTQLAISYAKWHRTSYTSVFWLDATSEASLKTSLRNVAHRALPPNAISELNDERILFSVSNWFSEYENNRWLLIFDNYDDPDHYSVSKYFPSVAHGSVIITTRQPNGVIGDKVRLQPLSKEDDSLCVLATRSERNNVESDPDARQLVRRLDGHPLALATAGAFLCQSSISFGQYLQQYEARWKVIDLMEELADYPSRTLYSTWNLTFTRIEQQHPRAAKLLQFLAYLDHRDIWFELLHHGRGENQPAWFSQVVGDAFMFETTIRVLARYCLVETNYRTGSYSLHTCVHDWTLNGLNREIDVNPYWLAFDCVARNIGTGDFYDLSLIRFQRFTEHTKRLVHGPFHTAACQQSFVRSRLVPMANLAELLVQRVQYDAAEQMYSWVLAGYENAVGVAHMGTLCIANNLGIVYLDQGKLGIAETTFMRVLAGEEKALGMNHSSTLTTVTNLGIVYRSQGKLGEAETMFIRALVGTEKALGTDHESTLDVVHNLGSLYHHQGKLGEAESMYMRVLVGREIAEGLDHTSTLAAVQSLAGKEKTLGSNHGSTLGNVNSIACVYRDQGKLVEAEKMHIRVLAWYKQALGSDSILTLQTTVDIGTIYCLQGELSKAEKFYHDAIPGFRRVVGPDYIDIIGTLNNLANLYCEQGKPAEAEPLYDQALRGITATLGEDHYYVSGVLNNRGLLNAERGNSGVARSLYLEARDGLEKSLGPEHFHTQMVCYNLQQLELAEVHTGATVLSSTGATNNVNRLRRRWYDD